MAEWEWQNVEWQNGGMAEWQNGGMAEWQNGRMAKWYLTTYLIYPAIFMVHDDNANNNANNNADNDADDDTDNANGF